MVQVHTKQSHLSWPACSAITAQPHPIATPKLTTHLPVSQYQTLADKYAPSAPDVAIAITKLHIPPPTPTSASFVPLPSRLHSDSSQAQLALFIREGKRVARELSMRADASKHSGFGRDTQSTKMTSDVSTVLEKDFTVEGKKGKLRCPFSAVKEDGVDGDADGLQDHEPHPAGDPICAAMDTTSAPPASGAAQCPIRFMDKHSPEEIARYVETHKHELPRSHEVCLRRNQKNEEQIRKLDAKYGNLVSMIEDLSHLHAPMLPEAELGQNGHVVDSPSDRRVSDWAQNVSAIVREGLIGHVDAEHEEAIVDDVDDDQDRASRFDRPLKEIRVGESPSRPWGISVPFPPDEPVARSISPPAPVRIPSLNSTQVTNEPAKQPAKCPFDHTKMRFDGPGPASTPTPAQAHVPKAEVPTTQPTKCPFDFSKMQLDGPGLAEFPKMDVESQSPPRATSTTQAEAASQAQPIPLKHPQPAPPDSPPPSHQPAFLNMPTLPAKEGNAVVPVPQMVFNGPVFIGYPMEQAIQFMQHFQSQQQPR